MPIKMYILPWISIVSLLAYIPVLCYLDWNYRDIGTHKIWLPLLAVNIPVVAAGYLTGYYPAVFLLLDLIVAMAWVLLVKTSGTVGD